MRLPRRGARIMIYAVLFAILAGAFVAAGFSAVNSEWVIAASGGIPILVTFLAASEREATQHAPEDTARELAKKLTAKVLANWTEEMENRGLKDDRRMELRWRAAEGSNASVGLGAGLAHEGTLSQLTDRIGHDTAEGRLPRLVVIGEMGGGKTACCVRLMVEIAERQSSNAELADWHRRVPVLFQLATWDPETSLQAWMIRQLPEIFPEIGTSGYERKVAALLVRRHVLPFLDGLDEVREPATALRAIDNQMTGRPFVLTCRTAEFACANDSGALRQAMIAELQGLRPDEVRGFLHRYEPRSPLIAMLEDQPAGPVAIVLSTPFMVSLARDADSSSPTLISAATTPDAEKATQRLLLETFIRKTYSHDDPDGPDEADDRTTLDEAWRYLQFLARQTDLAGRLAWWRLHRCVPAALFLVVAVCVGATVCSGLAALFFALFDHPWQGFWIGLGAGIAGALTAELIPQDDPRRARPRFRSLQIPMPFELARTVGFGLIGGAALAVIALFLYSSVPDIVLGSVLSGLTFALARYLSQPNDPLKVVTPGSLLRADRAAVAYAWLAGALPGAVTGAYLGSVFHAGHRLGYDSLGILRYPSPVLALMGALGGCVLSGAGLGLMAVGSSSWGRFIWTRLWLAGQGRTPLRLMSFLQDAHKRGVLRQVNGYYEFRHRILRDYLAESGPGTSVSAPEALAGPAVPP